MKKLFNTEFEVSMRLLILINSISSLNEDELAYLDFFSIYSKTFNFTNENLNGDCSFPINEITLQRKLIRNALKELVLKSLVKVNFDDENTKAPEWFEYFYEHTKGTLFEIIG